MGERLANGFSPWQMFTKKKQPIQHNYILHNHLLESVNSAKYLGITVQSNLKWDKHINDITSKGNKALGFLKPNLKTSNQQIKTQAHQVLVRSKLEYSCSIWDPHISESIRKIEMVQQRAARHICNRIFWNDNNFKTYIFFVHYRQWNYISN